jgi:hypothetical protein
LIDPFPGGFPIRIVPHKVKPSNKVEGLRDDSRRLRELLEQCFRLNTEDVGLLVPSASEVLSYARSMALEIGLDLRNPPIPKVCRKAGGDCGCGGQC